MPRSSCLLAVSQSLRTLSSVKTALRPSAENAITVATVLRATGRMRALESLQQLTRGCVPELDGRVLASGEHVAPVGENAVRPTPCECPSKVRSRRPVAASQSFRVLSALPESTPAPIGREGDRGYPRPGVPRKSVSGRPVARSQSFRVLSALPESTPRPSGENATEETL